MCFFQNEFFVLRKYQYFPRLYITLPNTLYLYCCIIIWNWLLFCNEILMDELDTYKEKLKRNLIEASGNRVSFSVNKSLLWKTLFPIFPIIIKNLNYKIWNMLCERYFVLSIANLVIRQAHDTTVCLIFETPPILKTFHVIILMKKMNLLFLWIIEFPPAVIY